MLDTAVIAAFETNRGGVNSVAWHSNGTQVLTGGTGRDVHLWDLATQKPVPLLWSASTRSAVAFAAILPRRAAAGKMVKVWNAADGKELASFTHPADVTGLSFNADRTRVATSSRQAVSRLGHRHRSGVDGIRQHQGPVQGVVFHPNNTNVISASADKTVAIHTLGLLRNVRLESTPRRPWP